MTKPLRMQIRLQNNRLIRAREAMGLSQKEAGQRIGTGLLNAFENLRHSPTSDDGEWTALARKIADFYGFEPAVLWPEVARAVRQSSATRELDGADIAGVLAALPPCPELPDAALERSERTEQLRAALGELSERDRLVLTECVGNDVPDTDMAERLGVSKSLIGAVRYRALGRVRRLIEGRQ